VPDGLFDLYASYASAPPSRPVFDPVEAAGETVVERIKGAISCYDFIRRYVDLDDRGRGLCPFHDDRVASFSVNRDEDYFQCFAGCGGGDLIAFYMMYRQRVEGRPGDFKTAVTELAQMLLTPQG
jgi:DNA primase